MHESVPPEVTKKKPTKKKFFFSYVKVMDELSISRRTLQRWIDDMEIEPLQFEDQLRVFLTLPQVEKLREYKKVMRAKDPDLIKRYRAAVETNNLMWLAKIRKELQ